MNEQRIFRFAHAGILVALIHAMVSSDPDKFDIGVWVLLAFALPATVFRGLISGHPQEDKYKAASGFALNFSLPATISAFAFTFANHSIIAASIFLGVSLLFSILIRYGEKS